ncbi:hypothetical protein CIRMBP1304_00760 [Enterococcus cecorum]|nr:hypothetical protein CIRMBP1304_00760 [Enterococcus cecorum]
MESFEIDKVDRIKRKIKREPDISLFEYEGFECVIARNDLGVLCGYLSFKLGHKLYGATVEYMETHFPYLPFHGGVTFANKGIYVDLPIITNDWYIGFDCAHSFDYIPAYENRIDGLEYRDHKYVKQRLKESVMYLIRNGVRGK